MWDEQSLGLGNAGPAWECQVFLRSRMSVCLVTHPSDHHPGSCDVPELRPLSLPWYFPSLFSFLQLLKELCLSPAVFILCWVLCFIVASSPGLGELGRSLCSSLNLWTLISDTCPPFHVKSTQISQNFSFPFLILPLGIKERVAVPTVPPCY